MVQVCLIPGLRCFSGIVQLGLIPGLRYFSGIVHVGLIPGHRNISGMVKLGMVQLCMIPKVGEVVWPGPSRRKVEERLRESQLRKTFYSRFTVSTLFQSFGLTSEDLLGSTLSPICSCLLFVVVCILSPICSCLHFVSSHFSPQRLS